MDNKDVMKAFTTHMDEFFTDLLVVCPNNKDVLRGKLSFEALKKANPAILVRGWKNQVANKFSDLLKEVTVDNIEEKIFNKDFSIEVKMAQDNMNIKDADNMLYRTKLLIREVLDVNPDNIEKCLKYIINLSEISKLYN